MKILTITLNPAFDMHCNVDNLQLYKENYVTSFVKHAGGKGVNISRSLTGFGIENTAVCVLGNSGGQEFLRLLQEDSICCNHIMTEGRIRENITIHSCDKETRISFEGFEINKGIIDDLYEMVKGQLCDDFVVTFTGRLCKGISNAKAVEFLKKVKSLGAKLIVDCNSFTIEELTEISPYLIKPNEQEISQLLGCEVETEADALATAQRLCGFGIENVIVSLGSKGFVFCNKNSKLIIRVPEIEPVSTIGAGDSLIAGFIAGLSESRNIVDVLKLAAAFGTAACLAEGTNPPRKSDILIIEEKVKIEKLLYMKEVKVSMLNVTIVQPRYFAGENPDEKIAQFLLEQLQTVPSGGLIVLPEYSNVGGLSDAESELKALPRAEVMLEEASKVAKSKGAYVSINVLQQRGGKLKNSTYLFDKNGEVAFIYDKQHLPPSEIVLGVEAGNGTGKCECVCELDGIKFAFLTCYDVYFNEQIELIAQFKPDIIIISSCQRGERSDILRAQNKMIAFRCNAYIARASFSMDDDGHGGCSMIVAPDGQILKDMGRDVGKESLEIDVFKKYMRTAGFGGEMIRNDDFISNGLCPEAF